MTASLRWWGKTCGSWFKPVRLRTTPRHLLTSDGNVARGGSVRQTHRTAIGNERIKTTTPTEVVFTVRADNKGGKRRERLPGTEFIKRFLWHVLPTGIKRIRHYGVLASACKGKKLPLAKAALRMPQSNAQAQESASAFMARVAAMDVLACPVCKAGRLRVVATALWLRQLPEPGTSVLPCNRGPPP